MKNKSSVGYGRTSSEDASGDKVSVDVQKQDYLKACTKNNWVNLGWFEDRDTSGRCYEAGSPLIPLDKVTSDYLSKNSLKKQTRLGLKKALDTKADIFVVRDITRFARPLSGSMLSSHLQNRLNESNTVLWSLDQGEIKKDLSQKILKSVQDELYDDDIKRKTAQSKASRLSNRDKGLPYTDCYCLGFRSYKGKVEVIPAELETVKKIFRLYEAGQTIRGITVKLNQDGNKPLEAKCFGRRSVTCILKRSWYAGYQLNSIGTYIESTEFSHYAVVSLNTWLGIQQRLNKNESSGVKRENKFAHVLAGLVRCGYCGALMVPYRATNAHGLPLRYYRCKNTYNDAVTTGHDCNSAMIRESYSELAAIDQKDRYIGKGVITDKCLNGLVEFMFPWVLAGYIKQLTEADITPELKDKKTKLGFQLEALKAKNVSRYKDYENKLFDKSTYQTLTQESKAIEESLNNQLKEVLASITTAANRSTIAFKDVEQLDLINHSTYTQLIKQVVSGVSVYQDRIEITVTDSDKSYTFPRLTKGKTRSLPAYKVAVVIDKTDKLVPKILIEYQYPKTVCQASDVYARTNLLIKTVNN